MKNVVIDLETLGVGQNVPLFEIGLTFFNLDGTVSSKQINVNIMDVMWRTGFCPQKGTLDWWREQSYNPSDAVDRVTLSDALEEVNRLFEEFNPEFVWANSPSFDLVILGQHYQALGMETPWKYYQELDFRTIKWLATQKGMKINRSSPSHNAEADSMDQTMLLMEMLKYV